MGVIPSPDNETLLLSFPSASASASPARLPLALCSAAPLLRPSWALGALRPLRRDGPR